MVRRSATPLLVTGLFVIGLIAAGAGLGGCAMEREEFADNRIERSVVTEIVAGGGSGGLTVKRIAGADLAIDRRVRFSGERPARLDRVDGSTLRLDGDCGEHCTIEYTVTVPDAVKVTGNLRSGDIRLTGVGAALVSTRSGRIGVTDVPELTAETASGNIDVADVRGAAVVRTGAGDISLKRIGGAVTAETSSGAIRAEGLSGPQATLHTFSGDVKADLGSALNLTATTSSGDVEVLVPGGTSYQVTAESTSGGRNVDVTHDPTARYRLDLHTESGEIRVRAARPA